MYTNTQYVCLASIRFHIEFSDLTGFILFLQLNCTAIVFLFFLGAFTLIVHFVYFCLINIIGFGLVFVYIHPLGVLRNNFSYWLPV